MRTIVKPLLCIALALACIMAHAQVFICKNAAGKTLTADRPEQDCVGEIREMGKSGNIVRVIAPPLTAEQKKHKRLEEEQRKETEAAAAEQKREDKRLLARYSSEKDVEAARNRSLEQSQEQIKRESQTLATAEKQLSGAKSEMDSYKIKKTPVPPPLARKMEDAELTIQTSKKIIVERQADAATINLKFDIALKRFRELTGEGAPK